VISLRPQYSPGVALICLFFFACFVVDIISYSVFLLYTVALIPFLCNSQFNFKLTRLLRQFWLFPVVFVGYGLYQKMFGYTSFEMGWVMSGKSLVGEEGLLLADQVRPFSMLAGIPEFSFFICILFYHEWFIKRRIYTSIGFLLLLGLMGSRGVLVGLIVSFMVMQFGGRLKKPYRFLLGIFLSIFVYMILVDMSDILLEADREGVGRMMVYGTFNARYEILRDFFENASLSGLLFGVGEPYRTFDNMYITLINDFGLFAVILFLYLCYVGAHHHQSEFAIILTMVFSLYADFAHSFFFMHLLAMMIYSKSEEDKRVLAYGH